MPSKNKPHSTSANTIPTHFPITSVQYLSQPIPAKHLPPRHRFTYCTPSITPPPNAPPKLAIKPITCPTHPAKGQFGLFASQKLAPKSWIRDYLGVVHTEIDVDPRSDYDLCLARIPVAAAAPPSAPPGTTITTGTTTTEAAPTTGKDTTTKSLEGEQEVQFEIVGIDATRSGNEARFVNDYRNVLEKPNAVFELRTFDLGGTYKGQQGVRMAVWAGPKGVEKGSEICVSYGRGFWEGRKGAEL